MECTAGHDRVDRAAWHDTAVVADRPAHQCRISERGQHAPRQHHDAGAGDGGETAGSRERRDPACNCSPTGADGGGSHFAGAVAATGGCEEAARGETSGSGHSNRAGSADPAIPNRVRAARCKRLIRGAAVAN